jgi:hypothetical protein
MSQAQSRQFHPQGELACMHAYTDDIKHGALSDCRSPTEFPTAEPTTATPTPAPTLAPVQPLPPGPPPFASIEEAAVLLASAIAESDDQAARQLTAHLEVVREMETETEKGVMEIAVPNAESLKEDSDAIDQLKLDIAKQTGVPIELISLTVQSVEDSNNQVEVLRRRRTFVVVVKLPKDAGKKLAADIQAGSVSQIGETTVTEMVNFHLEPQERVGRYASRYFLHLISEA